MKSIVNKLIGKVVYKPLCNKNKMTSSDTTSCQLIITGVEINGSEGQTLIGTAYGPDAEAEYQMDGLVAFDAEFCIERQPEIRDGEGYVQKVVFKNIEKLCL